MATTVGNTNFNNGYMYNTMGWAGDAAASNNNALASWRFLSGQPSRLPQADATSDLWTTHEDMPAAYEGKSLLIGQLINGLAGEKPSWLTSIALPNTFTNQIKYEWFEVDFDNNLTDPVPHQGTSRILQHTRQKRSASSQRRGVAMFFEDDFLTTPEGVQMFGMCGQQAILNIKLTAEYMAACAIMMAHDDPIKYNEMWGISEGNLNYMQRMNRAIEMFAIVNRPNGVYKMHADAMSICDKIPMTPNIAIVTERMMQYCVLGQERSTTYSYMGDRGVTALLKGDIPAFPMRDFGRLRHEHQYNYGLMNNQAKIGEFYLMLHKDVDYLLNPGEYRSSMRTIQRLDEEGGCWQDIDIESAIAAANDPGYTTVQQWLDHVFTVPFLEELAVAQPPNEALTWDQIKPALIDRVRKNEPVEVSFMIAAFNMTYKTDMVVYMRGGRETGATFHGHPNTEISRDGKVKTTFVHITYYLCAAVWAWKNIFYVKNALYNSYEYGNNSQFFTDDELMQLSNDDFDVERDDTNTLRSKSLVCFLIDSRTRYTDIDKRIHITGKFVDNPTASANGRLHYSTARAYSNKFHFTKLNPREYRTGAIRGVAKANGLLCSGHYTYYDFAKRKFETRANTGHHGPKVYPGCERVRNGMMDELINVSATHNVPFI